jgi:hypothetical protein
VELKSPSHKDNKQSDKEVYIYTNDKQIFRNFRDLPIFSLVPKTFSLFPNINNIHCIINIPQSPVILMMSLGLFDISKQQLILEPPGLLCKHQE